MYLPILRIFTATLLLVLCSCSTTYQKMELDLFYKRDIPLRVNGEYHYGVTVVPRAEEYDIMVEPQGEMDLVLIRSCHREATWEKQGQKKFLGIIPIGKNQFKYTYVPTQVEKDEFICPLRVETYSSSSGRHSWAMIDIQDTDRYKLSGKITCMGKKEAFVGVGVCQAKAGLIQRIEFNDVIEFATPKPSQCARPEYHNDAFELEVSAGECIYHARTSDNRLARITIVGFEGLLIREGQ